jgi:hypothetical protein
MNLAPEDLAWTMMIRVPEFITAKDLAAAQAVIKEKEGAPDAALVKLETIEPGRCVQMLHVGPYEEEPRTIEAMQAYAREQGLTMTGPHHEIYLSDPRRVPPERLKTILRHGVGEERD